MSASSREYDLVVLGATGYTGKLTAECITNHLPTDLRWAIAGRSGTKLEAVVAECKFLNADRRQPSVEVCSLDASELDGLAKKTTLLITTIGPYSLHGEPTFKACADNGTHYLDITGEAVWHSQMIKKYEKTAKKTGSIMIPQCGVDSAPADMMTWVLVNLIRENFSVPTAEVILSAKFGPNPSGGTMSSIFTIFDVYSLKDLSAANAPYALSPIPGPKIRDPVPWATKIFGFRVVRDLGILTTYIFAAADKPQVQRTWGLLGGANNYGPNFEFNEYKKTQNYLTAIVSHFSLTFGSLLLAIPFIRTLLRKLVIQPGDGPSKDEAKLDDVEYKGIANQDVQTINPPRAFAKSTFKGSAYDSMIVSSAAISILRDGHKLGGGIYTPACLGQKFLDRLQDGGFKFEKKIYND